MFQSHIHTGPELGLSCTPADVLRPNGFVQNFPLDIGDMIMYEKFYFYFKSYL